MSNKGTQHRSSMFYLVITSLMSWAAFLAVEVFHKQLYVVFSAETYLSLHILAELFSIIVSLSIFGFGWFTYRQSHNNYTLFLAIAFLGVGLLDFAHTLSFPGMPALITPSSTDKGIQFWLAARLLAAVAFFVSAFIVPGASKKPLPRKTILAAMLLFVAGEFVWVNFLPQTLLVFFTPQAGLTPAKIAFEYLVITITALALVTYYYRQRGIERRILVWFMCALILSMFSELAFMFYKNAYDAFNLLGHIFKVLAFVLIYRGVFIELASESYERVEESEKRFATAFLNSPTLMSITDPRTGKIFEVNDAFCDFFGYTRDELTGRTTKELNIWVDPKQREKVLHKLNSTGSARNAEVALRDKSGEIRYAIDSIDYIYLQDKKYLLSVASDITDRKRAEQALVKNEAHIKELSELRAKFIQIISHQLRTPLGSIRWNIESLLNGSLGKLTDVQKKFLQLTHDADVMVIRRINDLLTVMDIEEGRIAYERSSTTVDSLLRSVMTELQPKCDEKQIDCQLHISKVLAPVSVDGHKLRTVFHKLIENAITFTPKKGKINIKLKKIDSYLRFEISDTGVGIPQKEQTHVFTSFFRASNAFTIEPDASGVGLTIAKTFIEQQGGTMGFTSKEGKGSTFWFELPVETKD